MKAVVLGMHIAWWQSNQACTYLPSCATSALMRYLPEISARTSCGPRTSKDWYPSYIAASNLNSQLSSPSADNIVVKTK
jgi:hypothetical protein